MAIKTKMLLKRQQKTQLNFKVTPSLFKKEFIEEANIIEQIIKDHDVDDIDIEHDIKSLE